MVPLQQSSCSPKHSHQVMIESNKDIDIAELTEFLRHQLDKSCSFYV